MPDDNLPFSVGEAMVSEDIEEDRLAEATDSMEGYWANSCSRPSSPGRHVSTIASRQFTNSSTF